MYKWEDNSDQKKIFFTKYVGMKLEFLKLKMITCTSRKITLTKHHFFYQICGNELKFLKLKMTTCTSGKITLTKQNFIHQICRNETGVPRVKDVNMYKWEDNSDQTHFLFTKYVGMKLEFLKLKMITCTSRKITLTKHHFFLPNMWE